MKPVTKGKLRRLSCHRAEVTSSRIIEEAQKQFSAYNSGDKKAVHASLRLAVFRLAVMNGGSAEYEAVKQEYLSTTSIDGKEICLTAMGEVQSIDLVNNFLDFQFSDQVAVQDVHTGSIALANNPKAKDALWAYIKKNWDTIHGKLSANTVVIDRYLKTTLSKFSSHEVERDITKFFEGKDTKGYDRGLVQVSDTIQGNASQKERDGKLVLEWLKAHEYV